VSGQGLAEVQFWVLVQLEPEVPARVNVDRPITDLKCVLLGHFFCGEPRALISFIEIAGMFQ
jgi:hypothetical protein